LEQVVGMVHIRHERVNIAIQPTLVLGQEAREFGLVAINIHLGHRTPSPLVAVSDVSLPPIWE
jgi:hypothetical protein